MVIKGVILDVDGTLVDSNEAHAASWVEVLRANGYTIEYEKIRRLIGMGSDKLLPQAIGIEAESAEGKRLNEERAKLFKDRYLPTLKPFEYVRELLERMRADDIKLVVASSAEEEQLDALLDIAGVKDLIETQTSSDDAENSKPDPDIVQAALQNLKQPVDQTIMLGDTPYDVEAALKAQINIIALRCGGWDDISLRGAVKIYDNPTDLLWHYEQSPIVQTD
jgi:HAD superfamily hydrolase (TIGR01549 family)